jgi:hypothetical protein
MMLKKMLTLKRRLMHFPQEDAILFKNGMPKTAPLFSDDKLHELAMRYKNYPIKALSYATVKDFCDSFDYMRPLAELNGDLKDVQRPWTLKSLLSILPMSSRVLEIGAGEPWVGDFLSRLGHEVWVCDPYDGTGNGPREFDRYCLECPNIKFIRTFFSTSALDVPPHYFDAIYSISVLEHVPIPKQYEVFAGISNYLKPTGFSIHSIDHVHKGKGAEEHLQGLRRINLFSGNTDAELDTVLRVLSNDVGTYYLSAESHNRWRGGVPYENFPMRVCVSIHLCSSSGKICV